MTGRGVTGNRRAEADFDIVGVGTKHEEIDRHALDCTPARTERERSP
jgi:hypothetical protein